MTCRDEVLNAARTLARQDPSGEFTLDEVLQHLRRNGSRYKESTIRTHVTSRMCANAPDNHGTTYDDFHRLGHGRYRLKQGSEPGAHAPISKVNPVELRTKPVSTANNHDVHALSEDEIKHALNEWLRAAGWDTAVAWGHTPGIDIEARRAGHRWVIEVKGPGSRPPMRVNYFLAILGETLQRMDDESTQYSIALPDLPQYRGLWNRLPRLAKTRTGISAIFIDSEGKIEHTESHGAGTSDAK